MTDEKSIREHEIKVMRVFSRILRAEDNIRIATGAKKDAVAAMASAELDIEKAWSELKKMMDETGEVEIILPGETTDYQIGYGRKGESVDVPDVEALPEEYVKTEKKADKELLGKHLRALRSGNQPMPNYATLKESEPQLKWVAIKKRV